MTPPPRSPSRIPIPRSTFNNLPYQRPSLTVSPSQHPNSSPRPPNLLQSETNKMPATIRVIGSLNADMVSVTPRFPDAGETITSSAYFTSAGGKGANQAVACGRQSRPRPQTPTPTQNPTETHSTSPNTSDVAVEMAGAVGGLDGHFDALLKPTLEQSGVSTKNVRVVPDAYTGVAVIIVDSSAGGENRILFSPGANYSGMQCVPEVVGMSCLEPIPDVMILQGEIPTDTTVALLGGVAGWKKTYRENGRRGLDAGADVVFNPAPAPPGGLPVEVYRGVDHLVMNETEAEIMTPGEEVLLGVPGIEAGQDGKEKVARYFHSLGVTFVIITLGAKGVWYSAAGAEGVERVVKEVPAAKVSRVLDTTAAGDTFVGAYAVQIARWRERRRVEGRAGEDLSAEEQKARYEVVMEAIEVATRAAARCVERQGAMDSIPWEDEI
ncbi:Ribokinase-like protein [Aspergillus varians]